MIDKLASAGRTAAADSATSDLCLQVAAALVLVVAYAFLAPVVVFAVGGHLSPGLSRALLALALVGGVATSGALGRKTLPIAALAVAAIYLVSLALNHVVIDTSYDGQEYHNGAITALAEGWNPLRQDYAVAASLRGAAELLPWPQHYPKAFWISSALQVSAGFSGEAAKNQAFLLWGASALSLFGAALKLGAPWRPAAALALVASLNPVTLVQMFSRMNDGAFASCAVIFVAFAALWVARRETRALIPLAAVMIVALNLKFSVAPMLGVLCGAICLAWWLRGGLKSALGAGVALGAIGAFAMCVAGYDPYIQNLLQHGHPFYPVIGDAKTDVMDFNRPKILQPMSYLGRLFFSLFSTLGQGYVDDVALKIPFTVTRREVWGAGSFDTRVSGFGPLFSGALVLVAFAGALLAGLRSRGQALGWGLFASAALVASALINPENWWARYVPQLWLAVILIAGIAMLSDRRAVALVGWAATAVLALNVALVGVSSLNYVGKRVLSIHHQDDELRGWPRACVFYGANSARKPILEAAGVKAVTISRAAAEACPKSIPLQASFPKGEGYACPC